MFSKDEESLRYLLKNSGLKKGETLNFSHVKNEYHSVMKEMGEFKYTVASYSYTIDLNEKVIEKLQTEKKKQRSKIFQKKDCITNIQRQQM